jgi:hypothetical protein
LCVGVCLYVFGVHAYFAPLFVLIRYFDVENITYAVLVHVGFQNHQVVARNLFNKPGAFHCMLTEPKPCWPVTCMTETLVGGVCALAAEVHVPAYRCYRLILRLLRDQDASVPAVQGEPIVLRALKEWFIGQPPGTARWQVFHLVRRARAAIEAAPERYPPKTRGKLRGSEW